MKSERELIGFLVQKLIEISEIENKTDGGDWDEIEEAREMARNALDAYYCWE
jgi:hypothetical protein